MHDQTYQEHLESENANLRAQLRRSRSASNVSVDYLLGKVDALIDAVRDARARADAAHEKCEALKTLVHQTQAQSVPVLGQPEYPIPGVRVDPSPYLPPRKGYERVNFDTLHFKTPDGQEKTIIPDAWRNPVGAGADETDLHSKEAEARRQEGLVGVDPFAAGIFDGEDAEIYNDLMTGSEEQLSE